MTLGAARVIYSINDLSLYVDQLTRGYVIAVVQAERGPLWTPTPVATWDEYERIFGRTFPGSSDPLVLKMGLLQGAKFLVIRVVHCVDQSDPTTMTAVCSTATLKDRGGVPSAGFIDSSEVGPFGFIQALSGRVTGSEVGPFTFGLGTSDQLKVKVGTAAAQTITLTGATQTATQVADQINAETTGLTASVVANKIKLVANNAADSLEIQAVATDAYSQLGLIVGVYSAAAGTDSLHIAIDGASDQNFVLAPANGEEGHFALTASQVVGQLSGLTGATATSTAGKIRITSSTLGTNSSVKVQSSSTAATSLGFDSILHSGTSGPALDTLKFTAKNPGKWGDYLKIQTYAATNDPVNCFGLRVRYLNQSGLNEYFDDLSMDPHSERYAPTYINERSHFVVVEDLNSTNVDKRPAVNNIGTSLAGGDDGLVGFTDSDWIGDDFAQTGFYAADKTDMSIDIMIPGTHSVSVIQALVAYCELRGDLIAYVNPPAGLDPLDTVAWRGGEDPYSFEKWNSHRLTFWFGRPLCYDSRYDSRKNISNLGHLAACLGKTDSNYDYFYAPVGPRRGTVDFVEGIDFNMADFRGYQDMFAENQINYLQLTRSEGAVFWEQYTSLLVPSALRDLNVVRFLTMMRKVLVPVLRTFVFEPNHPVTWGEIYRTLMPQLELWKKQNAIYTFHLQTDRDAFFDDTGELKNAVLNTGQEIDQGIYHARVLIQPTRAIRYLEFEVGVMRTGELFSNYTELKTLPGWVRS